MINNTYVRPQRMKCVNCGEDIMGWKDEKSGMVKMKCQRCGTGTVSRPMSRRHIQLDVYGPPKQVLYDN